MTAARIKRHWTQVAAMGCCITGRPAEIAHCHGGSMVPLIGPHAKGKKLRRFDWLVIPLAPEYHRVEFREGLDGDVLRWESLYGTQVEWLDYVSRYLRVNVWKQAGVAREVDGMEGPK